MKTKTLIAKKHAAAISNLFNTIRANEMMAADPVVGGLPASYWEKSTMDTVRILRDQYGIEVPGYTRRLA